MSFALTDRLGIWSRVIIESKWFELFSVRSLVLTIFRCLQARPELRLLCIGVHWILIGNGRANLVWILALTIEIFDSVLPFLVTLLKALEFLKVGERHHVCLENIGGDRRFGEIGIALF